MNLNKLPAAEGLVRLLLTCKKAPDFAGERSFLISLSARCERVYVRLPLAAYLQYPLMLPAMQAEQLAFEIPPLTPICRLR